MYTNQIDNFHQFGRNKTSSLIGVYENMSNIFKTTEHDSRLHRNTLQSQTAASKNLRKPTYSLSLPRKPLSNSKMVPIKDNILTGKKCDSNFLPNKTEDINNLQLPKSHPPYYCSPLNKSDSMKKSSNQNDIQNGNPLNHNITQQVGTSTQLSNLCYESSSEFNSSPINGNWKSGETRDHSITTAEFTERFHQNSSDISVPIQKQINSNINRNNCSVADFSPSNKLNLNTSHVDEMGIPNETNMAQGDLGSNPKMKLNRPINKQRQIQLQLQQNPQTRQLFAVIQEEVIN